VDLSDNQLCDTAAVDELTRLVKNYSAFAANNFISELLLNGNNIGKTGATKLIQYAHWERDRFKTAENPPPRLKLNLSDNCIDRPSELADELKSKRIKLTCVADDDDKESTVYLPDFMDQRDPPREKPISTSRYNGNRGPVGRPSRPPPPRQIRRDRSHSFERRDRGRDRGGYRGRERSRSGAAAATGVTTVQNPDGAKSGPLGVRAARAALRKRRSHAPTAIRMSRNPSGTTEARACYGEGKVKA